VTTLPRPVVSAGYWASAAMFGLIALLLWTVWLYGLAAGHPPQIDFIGRHLSLDFVPTWRWGAFLVAFALQAGWIWVVARHRPPRSSSLLAWPVGLILGWGLLATLHLPWLDEAKSYRGVFTELKRALPAGYNCIADPEDMRLRECERGMLHYVAGIATEHVARPEETRCDLILAEARVRHHGSQVDLGPGWDKLWEGSRPADERDRFILFQRRAMSD
jgi:hypothetical protein